MGLSEAPLSFQAVKLCFFWLPLIASALSVSIRSLRSQDGSSRNLDEKRCSRIANSINEWRSHETDAE